MGESGEIRVLANDGQDATMMEIGERGQPPGDPPDGSGSWVGRVTGGGVGGRLVPERLVDAKFVPERVQLAFPDGEDGEPDITIGADVLEAMNDLWKQCLIVKVLGRNIAITALTKKLRELWGPKGGMYVMDLPRHFFIVRFDVEAEYMAALTGGPWRVFGSYLLKQTWSPSFDPLRDEIITTPVWVRISDIPVNFYHEEILLAIARGLGKPVKVDLTTLNFERARFARVCVEVNLTKPLKGPVRINGERYFVAYEGLTNICSGCGIYGHLVHNCPRRVVEQVVERSVDRAAIVIAETAKETNQDGDGFTMVRRRGKAPAVPEKPVVFTAGASNVNLER